MILLNVNEYINMQGAIFFSSFTDFNCVALLAPSWVYLIQTQSI
jgi:hypothetical protein